MTPIATRSYAGSTVQMLTVINTLIAHAKEHQSELVKVLSTYTPEYFSEVKAKIDELTESRFGKDVASQLRKATALLNGMQKEALDELSMFKSILETQFPKEPAFVEESLKVLGFTSHYRAARTRSQESLVLLLAKFRQQMTEELKSKILAKGAQPSLIEGLLAKGNELYIANVSQEVFKDHKKEDTQENILQFNELYREVIGIAKLASRVFKDKPALKDKFNYTKHLKALTGAANAGTVAKKAKAKGDLVSI